MAKYTEILRLKQMLDAANIPYQSFDDDFFDERKNYGIFASDIFYPAYSLKLNDDIDVIEHCGSYGNENDLLEIMGAMTEEECEEDGGVLGHLTAEEVFKRFKYCYEHNTAVYVKEQGEE